MVMLHHVVIARPSCRLCRAAVGMGSTSRTAVHDGHSAGIWRPYSNHDGMGWLAASAGIGVDGKDPKYSSTHAVLHLLHTCTCCERP